MCQKRPYVSTACRFRPETCFLAMLVPERSRASNAFLRDASLRGRGNEKGEREGERERETNKRSIGVAEPAVTRRGGRWMDRSKSNGCCTATLKLQTRHQRRRGGEGKKLVQNRFLVQRSDTERKYREDGASASCFSRSFTCSWHRSPDSLQMQ